MRKITEIIVSLRLFALPASVMPYFIGTAAAYYRTENFSFTFFAAGLAALVMIHCGLNLVSDAADFEKGLDRAVLPVSGGIVRGYFSVRQTLAGALFLLSAGAFTGIWLAYKVSWLIAAVGTAGIGLGLFYPPLKYRAFGDMLVFIIFGLLVTLGGWLVQTGSFSSIPLFIAVPQGLLVVAILHSNNWRDIGNDTTAGIKTVASLLGIRNSRILYYLLTITPFLFVTAYVATGLLPLSVLTVWVAAIDLAGALKTAQRGELQLLDARTARLNLFFGVLYAGGIWAGHWL